MSETPLLSEAPPLTAAEAGGPAPADGPREPARVVGMPLVVRCTAGPLIGVLASLYATSATSHSWFGGLVVPLGGALLGLENLARILTWQIGQDRDGLLVASGLRVRRWSWDEVKGVTVRGSTLTLQFKGGDRVSVRAWPTRLDGHRLNSGGFAVAVAGIVSASAACPQRRPAEALPALAVGRPQLLLNRLSVAALVLFAVGRYFL
ncbi:hypothetical protein [Kitasatospora sp. KL5]|uniref:hypothetical protein n=1 Tax=Kitasatospora sp. KL5 TaxID=3425125 RepID=UPI003D7011B8